MLIQETQVVNKRAIKQNVVLRTVNAITFSAAGSGGNPEWQKSWVSSYCSHGTAMTMTRAWDSRELSQATSPYRLPQEGWQSFLLGSTYECLWMMVLCVQTLVTADLSSQTFSPVTAPLQRLASALHPHTLAHHPTCCATSNKHAKVLGCQQ